MITFDCVTRLGGFDFSVAFETSARLTGIIGPSGSGKSTVIRMIAGLLRPERGRITVGGEALLDTTRGVNRPPHRRGVGLVFQDAQLFPHLSVRQNLLYGRYFTPPSARRVDEEAVVGVLGIGHLMTRVTDALSGGERQRVAIGRALLSSPRLLLLDEPLAALDAARKLEILPFIERMRDELAIPMIYVSHSAEEIARLAGHVVRIENGRVTAQGQSQAVLAPTIGEGERFDALSMIVADLERYDAHHEVSILSHPAGRIVVPCRLPPGSRVSVAIRATQVALATAEPRGLSIRTSLHGRIAGIETSGPFALVSITLEGGDRIAAYATRYALDDLQLSPGAPVWAMVKAVAFDERGIAHR